MAKQPLTKLRVPSTPARAAAASNQVGLAQMLKGGVIMDVTTAEEARIAEEAGAVAVMALERVPADIRKDGGVARMSDASMIKAIKDAVTIPVMAKARIGHFVEAQILEALDVDYVDESEVRRVVAMASARNVVATAWVVLTGWVVGVTSQMYTCAQLHGCMWCAV